MSRWLGGLLVVVAAAVGGIWWSARSELDGRFAAVSVGQPRADVLRLLGPPVDATDETVRRVAGFRAVDHPGLAVRPAGTERVWWSDARRRCLYVEFVDGQVTRAALFAPGWERRK